MDQDQADIQKILAGDARGYRSLLQRHRSRVFTVAKKVVGDPALAEEVAQDVFIKAFKSLEEFRGDARFGTWLYRIAWTTAISALRREKRHRGHEDVALREDLDDPSPAFPDGFSLVARDEQKQLIDRALQGMKPEERFALTLFYLEERSLNEIAEITGEEVGTIKVRLFRARQRMASRLQLDLQNEWASWR
jgi:RNA polymerase sigma-70 factor (ECF subfamily)